MKAENCEGCLTHENHINYPTKHFKCTYYDLSDKKCPCQYCLIKMMCSNACDNYAKHKRE